MKVLFSLVFAALPLAASQADTVNLSSANTKVAFVGTKPGGKHNGGFSQVSGTAGTEAGKLASIEAEIDAASLFADDPKLTNHLKSPDFFDVKKFPKASFKSTKINVDKDGEATVTGDLTLHGVTKSISFPATYAVKDGQLELSSSFKINRTDFGMTFGEGKVDNDVSISVKVGPAAK